MAKIMDPILPILSVLRYWAIILGSFGGPGKENLAARANCLPGLLKTVNSLRPYPAGRECSVARTRCTVPG